jgi:hypothetical protein
MKKQEFLIPALALALAAILGIYLVINAGNRTAPDLGGTDETATSTVATSTIETGGDSVSAPPRGGYYFYGPVTLALNQAARFKNGLSMRPLAITEDSRCPQDVQCVSAGTVKAQVRIRTDVGTPSEATEVQVFTLNEPRTVDGTVITLTGVTPAAMAQTAIAASSYRLTFEVREAVAAGPCYIGGCSAQLCTDRPDMVSTCEYRAEYGCYKSSGAKCERQTSGKCGWTENAALRACLANPS